MEDKFIPSHSHVKDVVTLIINGQFYTEDDTYVCIFKTLQMIFETAATVTKTELSSDLPIDGFKGRTLYS